MSILTDELRDQIDEVTREAKGSTGISIDDFTAAVDELIALRAKLKEQLIQEAKDAVYDTVRRIWRDNRRDVVPYYWQEGEPDRGEEIDGELAVALENLTTLSGRDATSFQRGVAHRVAAGLEEA